MKAIDATEENARRLLKAFPGRADHSVMPDARVDAIWIEQGGDGFGVRLVAGAAYPLVRGYYGRAMRETSETWKIVERDEGVVFLSGHAGNCSILIADDGGGVHVTLMVANTLLDPLD